MKMADPLPDRGHGNDDERTARELVRALDVEASALDPRITARLARARREAFERDRQRRTFAHPALGGTRFALAGLAMMTALVAIVVTTLPVDETLPPPIVEGAAALEVLPVLSGTEDLEFYDSIDFLLWLEGQRA